MKKFEGGVVNISPGNKMYKIHYADVCHVIRIALEINKN